MLLELCDYLIICLHVRWLKLKQFDIWRGGDELHCATAAWSLIYFQHISYYHVAFQKASLAHPTRVKGKGTSCIWNSTCKSSHIQILPTPGTHIHTHSYETAHALVEAPLWCWDIPERMPPCQQVSGLYGWSSVLRHESSRGCQTHVLNIAHKCKFLKVWNNTYSSGPLTSQN